MVIYQQNDFYRIVQLKLPKRWSINNITQNSHILLQDNDFEIPYIDMLPAFARCSPSDHEINCT